MTFTKLLCATDFSAGAQQAVRAAARLAAHHDAELVIAHVWSIPTIPFAGEYVFSPAAIQEMSDEAQQNLEVAVRDAAAAGATRVSGTLLTGTAWVEIDALLAAQPFDLCVIGTHGRTGLSRILLGSVAEKILRHAPCSVLAVRPDGALATPYTRVLVPTDLSAGAAHALELAAQLVHPDGEIRLLHVLELPVSRAGEVALAEFARELDQQSATALDQAAAQVRRMTKAGVAVRTRVGYPGAQILAALEAERDFDLVVMGSHGRTGLRRVLLGSVAEKVVRHAHCPVLVARQRT